MCIKRISVVILTCLALAMMVVLSACQPVVIPVPKQSPTPAPAPGQPPYPAQTQEDFNFKGVIQSISSDKWIIGGQTFKVDQYTEMDSGLAVGVTARVEYVVLPDGTKLARQIETP